MLMHTTASEKAAAPQIRTITPTVKLSGTQLPTSHMVIDQALAPYAVEALRQETVRICRGRLGHVRGLPPVLLEDSDAYCI
jgi:hypothetical protein